MVGFKFVKQVGNLISTLFTVRSIVEWLVGWKLVGGAAGAVGGAIVIASTSVPTWGWYLLILGGFSFGLFIWNEWQSRKFQSRIEKLNTASQSGELEPSQVRSPAVMVGAEYIRGLTAENNLLIGDVDFIRAKKIVDSELKHNIQATLKLSGVENEPPIKLLPEQEGGWIHLRVINNLPQASQFDVQVVGVKGIKERQTYPWSLPKRQLDKQTQALVGNGGEEKYNLAEILGGGLLGSFSGDLPLKFFSSSLPIGWEVHLDNNSKSYGELEQQRVMIKVRASHLTSSVSMERIVVLKPLPDSSFTLQFDRERLSV